MLAVIDSRKPRVLRCNPDCPSFILDNPCDDVCSGEYSRPGHGHINIKSSGLSRKMAKSQEHKHCKRKSKHCNKITLDTQAIISIENNVDKEKEVNVRLARQLTCHQTNINDGYDLVDHEVKSNLVKNSCLPIHLHHSTLQRLPKSSTVFSQCSCCLRTNSRCKTNSEKENSEKSFINNRYKNNENKNKIQRLEKRTIDNSKRQSYFQFALLFFLVAFGHPDAMKTSVTGVVTFSTIQLFWTPTWAASIGSGEFRNRIERGVNLSQEIGGTSRLIRLYINEQYLQILPNHSISGTFDDTSYYTIVGRKSVGSGHITFIGSATCLYLCMDPCGYLFTSPKKTDSCIFKEEILENGYNYYASLRKLKGGNKYLLSLSSNGKPQRLKVNDDTFGGYINEARTLTLNIKKGELTRLTNFIPYHVSQKDSTRIRHSGHCDNFPWQTRSLVRTSQCRKKLKQKEKEKNLNSPHAPSNSTKTRQRFRLNKKSCENASNKTLCEKKLRNGLKKRRQRQRMRKGDEKSQPRRRNKNQERIKKLRTADALKNSMSVETLKNSEESPTVATRQQKKPVGKRTSSNENEKPIEETLDPTLLPGMISEMSVPTRYSMLKDHPTRTVRTFNSQNHELPTNLHLNAPIKLKPIIKPQSPKINFESKSSLPSSSSSEVPDFVDSRTSNDASIEEEEEEEEEEMDTENIESSSIDYVTLMTTMDTTSPERTEDYTKATTQSIQNFQH